MATSVLVRAPVPNAAAGRPPLRVLDVTKFYSAGASGGVRTYLDAKMADFAGRDIEHTLVIPAAKAGQALHGRTRVYRIAGPYAFSRHYRLMVSARALERIVRRERPHVIEVGSPLLVPFLVRRAIRGTAIRTVGFYHSDLVRAYAEPFVRRAAFGPLRVATRNVARRLVRAVYGRFDVTVAASPSVAAELESIGVPDVRCIPMGVDLELFQPEPRTPDALRAALGVAPAVPIALYAGRLWPEKRLDVLLDGHARIPEPVRPHLLVVGYGPGRPELERLAAGRTDVTVRDYIADRHALAQLYRDADFYVAPGPGETFGLAIAEAMAAGLPVVAVDAGAAPDRVRGSGCGELYRHGDAESCAAALRTMSEAVRSGRDLRTRARRHAAAFSWKRTFDSLTALYAELAGLRV